jgi:hypothetical protein
VRPAYKLDVSTSTFFYDIRYAEMQGEFIYKLLPRGGFIHNKVPAIATMFRMEIKHTPCTKQLSTDMQ